MDACVVNSMDSRVRSVAFEATDLLGSGATVATARCVRVARTVLSRFPVLARPVLCCLNANVAV